MKSITKKKLSLTLKLGVSIILSFLSIIGLVLCITAQSSASLKEMKELLYDKICVISTEIINADRDFYQAALAETKLGLSPDMAEADRNVIIADFEENRKQVFDRITAALEIAKNDPDLYKNFKNSETGMSLEEIYDSFVINYNHWNDAYNLATGEGDVQLRTSVFDSTRSDINHMTELLDEYSTKEAEEIAGSAFVKIMNFVIIVGMIFVICAAVFIWIMIHTVKSIKYVTDINKQIADGNFTVKIPEKKKTTDEVGQLCTATSDILGRLNNYSDYIEEVTQVLNSISSGDMQIDLHHDYSGEFAPIKAALLRISESLNRTLTEISTIASQVDTGAVQVSNSAQLLSQGAVSQASTLQELAAAICEISKGIQHNADKVAEANGIVERTQAETQSGSDCMNRMITAVNAIKQSSTDISKIIKVIDDIAFQTNILALNASVEAARAGTAGKGFAVVANEVRNLAAKSAEAAKNTAALISESLEKVNEGTAIADTTAASLANIVTDINDISTLMESISDASASQAQSITQINDGIEQISNVVQTNSATAEQNAAASEELSGQAKMLTQEVSAFKLYN